MRTPAPETCPCPHCGRLVYSFLDECPYCRKPLADPAEWQHGGSPEGETPTAPCPRCGRPIYDFSEKCPACGEWIAAPGGLGGGWPRWFWLIGLLLTLLAILWWILYP